ncbi:phosphatidylinositide phosphatase SAC2-like [Liolophura sinensis]|uniref:phosphatidylinositide phosphatase SAC2-like n=1 Tax=Liolophura sinensis TaxID=3198878 RepID=UPI0031583765
MELYQASDHYILVDGEHSLWCNRFNGSVKAGKGTDLCLAWNPICLGLVYGVVGKIKPHPDSENWLILIRQTNFVGKFFDKHEVFKIEKIAVLPLSTSEPADLDIDLCRKHHFGIKKPERITQAAQGQKRALQKTLSSIKSAAENVKPKKKEVKDKEKFEKKMLEELLKMFNDGEGFYFCNTMDLTTNIQQQHQSCYDKSKPLWVRADERFFWNRHMLKELIDSEDELAQHWIQPIVHGYIQQEWCVMDFSENHSPADNSLTPDFSKNTDCLCFLISLISRRSRHRAGTRSKKRGLDETGACANYVETEQVIEYSPHVVSFVQVRGSAPMFWSQSGFKYRPPPVLDKGA